MVWGTASYEGRVRICDNCGTRTNVFSTCTDCDETICEACDHTCPNDKDTDAPHIDDCPYWADEPCTCFVKEVFL